MSVSVTREPGCAAAVERIAAAPRAAMLRRGWFGDAAGLETLVVRMADRPVAALPLRRGKGVAQVAGSYWPFRSAPVAERLDPAALVAALRSRTGHRAFGMATRVGPLPEDDPLVAPLRAAARPGGWHLLERDVGRCWVQTLDGPPPPSRRDAKRERGLAEAGAVSWHFLSGRDWTAALIEELAQVERASWMGTRDAQTKFADPVERARWAERAADPVLAGMMRLCLLRVGGRAAAFSLDLDADDTRFGVCCAYDRALHRHSPGRLVHARSLAEAASRGIKHVNWGVGDSGYKREMGADAGPAMLDLLLVRAWPGLPALAARWWRTAPARGEPR